MSYVGYGFLALLSEAWCRLVDSTGLEPVALSV